MEMFYSCEQTLPLRAMGNTCFYRVTLIPHYFCRRSGHSIQLFLLSFLWHILLSSLGHITNLERMALSLQCMDGSYSELSVTAWKTLNDFGGMLASSYNCKFFPPISF